MTFLDLFLPFARLLVFCAIIAVILLLLLIPISKSKRATYAVLKRNFAAYFSNPTGYVFICVFMLLSSIAAFWPQAFFSRRWSRRADRCARGVPHARARRGGPI